MDLSMILTIFFCTVFVFVSIVRLLTTNLQRRVINNKKLENSGDTGSMEDWKRSMKKCSSTDSFCVTITPLNSSSDELSRNSALRESLRHAKHILEGIVVTGTNKNINFGLENLGTNVLGQAAGDDITLNSNTSMVVCEAETVSDFTFKECFFRPLIRSAYQYPINMSNKGEWLTPKLTHATAVTIVMIHEILHTLGVVCVGNTNDNHCMTTPPRFCGKNAKQMNNNKCIPLENSGKVNDGTHGVHFSESHYAHEIMTGWLDYDPRFNQSRYISPREGSTCHKYVSTHITGLTTAVLQDNNYTVNMKDYVVQKHQMNSDYQCIPLLDKQHVRAEQRKDGKPMFHHQH